eukprot:354619-Chlamydomonas_euryale.AAC.3
MADIEAALWGARHARGGGGGGGGASLVLATDPDREGEAISWHLAELLAARGAIGPLTRVSRVAFSEITKDAVLEAMAQVWRCRGMELPSPGLLLPDGTTGVRGRIGHGGVVWLGLQSGVCVD